MGPLGVAVACPHLSLLAAKLGGRASTNLGAPHPAMCALPRGGRPQIEDGAQRYGHDGSLLSSSAWPEHLVRHLTEPALENLHLRLGDRDGFRPVAGDGPGREVMLRRAAGGFGRARHGDRIAEPGRWQNSVSPRCRTLPLPVLMRPPPAAPPSATTGRAAGDSGRRTKPCAA